MENLNNYKDAYNQSFNFYDENQWYLAQYAKYMTKAMIERKTASILSLGIGHEVVSRSIIQLLTEKMNYDIVEGAADIISAFSKHNSHPALRVYENYFETFMPTRKYDAIEMGFVLEHVNDPLSIVKQYRQYLNPGGIIYIAVPNAKSLHRVIGHYAGLLPDMYALGPYDIELGHKRYYDLDSITNLVTEAGMQVSVQKGLMLKPITGDQMRKLEWQKNIIDALFIIGEDYPAISNCIYLETKNRE